MQLLKISFGLCVPDSWHGNQAPSIGCGLGVSILDNSAVLVCLQTPMGLDRIAQMSRFRDCPKIRQVGSTVPGVYSLTW